MASIKIDNATVNLTEVTVNEIKRAIDKAKAEGALRVLVKSEWAPIKFLISLEIEPHRMESCGYRGEAIKEPILTPDPVENGEKIPCDGD